MRQACIPHQAFIPQSQVFVVAASYAYGTLVRYITHTNFTIRSLQNKLPAPGLHSPQRLHAHDLCVHTAPKQYETIRSKLDLFILCFKTLDTVGKYLGRESMFSLTKEWDLDKGVMFEDYLEEYLERAYREKRFAMANNTFDVGLKDICDRLKIWRPSVDEEDEGEFHPLMALATKHLVERNKILMKNANAGGKNLKYGGTGNWGAVRRGSRRRK